MSRSRKSYSRYDEDRDDSPEDSHSRGRERKIQRALRELRGARVYDNEEAHELYTTLED